MRLIKIILSVCFAGGLIYAAIYGISALRAGSEHQQLAQTVRQVRGDLEEQSVLPFDTAVIPTDTPPAKESPAPAVIWPPQTGQAAETWTAAPAAQEQTPVGFAELLPERTENLTIKRSPASANTPEPAETDVPKGTVSPVPTQDTDVVFAPTAAPTDMPAYTPAPTPSLAPTAPAPDPDELLLEQYRVLAARNPDMVGWVHIEGTSVDYPVMHTPEDGEYYLHRNFDREYAFEGIPFLDERCDLKKPSDNLIIYGHNMRSGSMFGELKHYEEPEFFREHPVISFDTLDRRSQYRVFAVISVKLGDMDSERMRCYSVIMTEDKRLIETMRDYVQRYATLYDLDAMPGVGGEVLTLSTCTGMRYAHRLVVMAARIDEPEQQSAP